MHVLGAVDVGVKSPWVMDVSSTGNRTCVENRLVYYATGTEIDISTG
jgi:hypothetical protein